MKYCRWFLLWESLHGDGVNIYTLDILHWKWQNWAGYEATWEQGYRNYDVDSCKDGNIHAAVAVSSSLQGSLEVCTHGGVPMSIQQVCLC